MKLILIDDDEIFLYTLSKYFEAHDYEVLTAENGKEALDIIRLQEPDLIITDIRMPEMSGIELINYLHHRGNNIPVILISGFDDKQVMRSAFKLGPVDFFIKPFDKADLLRLVKRIESGNYERVSVGD